MSLTKFIFKSAGQVVENVSITVLDLNGALVTNATSNASGEAFVDLTNGDVHYAVMSHVNHIATNKSFVADDQGAYLVELTAKELKLASDTNFCLVQGNLSTLSGAPYDWSFTVSSAEGYTGTEDTVMHGDLVVSSINGYFEFALYQGESYVVSNLPFCNADTIYIPKTRGAKLADILSPRVTTVNGLAASLTISKKEIKTIPLTVTLSNTLAGADVEAGYLGVTVDDDSIVSASVSTTYDLVLTATDSPGVTTVRLTTGGTGTYKTMPIKEVGTCEITVI